MNWWLGRAGTATSASERPWLPPEVAPASQETPDPRGKIGFRNSGSYMGEDAEVVPPEFAADCAAEGGE